MPSTILCVDDDPGFLRILARAFREQGYQVATAADGEAALEQLKALRPQLVTLDVMLPRRDGFSVLEEIRGRGGDHLPVILLSGARFSPEYEARAKELAVDATLTKPVPLKKLLSVVAKLVPQNGTGKAKPIDLAGTLEDMPFAFLLHHLHGMRASGVLRVEQGSKKKLIQLQGGQPVAVRSNMMKETLGHLLVASGTITWDVLHESVRRVKEGEGLQGQILKAMYMLDDEDLARALHQQSTEKLLEVFGWSTGSFRFQQNARIRGEAAGLKCAPATLILEGIRGRTPIESVDGYLRERAHLYPCLSSSPFHEFQSVDIGSEVQEILQSLDGSKTVRSLMARPEEERRVLLALVATGHVDLEPRPVAQVAPLPSRAGRVLEEKVRAVDDRAEGNRVRRVRSELAELAERFQGDNAFEMFDLTPSADDAAIRSAYADLAHRTHPDRFARDGEAVRRLAEEVFDHVTRAYQSIATAKDRARSEEARREQSEIDEGQQALRAELAYQQGMRALKSRLHTEALKHFASAVEAYPEEGEYHAMYGWALYLEDPDRVREAKRHALHGKKLAPNRSAPLVVLGRLCKAQEKLDLAEKLFAQAVEQDPDCGEALQELRLMALRKRNSKGGLLRRILKRSA